MSESPPEENTPVTALRFDVGPGWRPLLQEMHDTLTAEGIAYRALQVKEKWGILRVYISTDGEFYPTFDIIVPGVGVVTGTTEKGTSRRQRAMEIVRSFEVKSKVICEDCGSPGELRDSRHWLRTLCDTCERIRI